MQKPKSLFIALLMALAGLLAISATATAQEQSSKVIPNAVWVGADGKFESAPDTALVQFGVSAQEEKLQDATQKATQAAEQIRQLLRSNGLDPKDAQISRFATQPVYDYKNPKRKLVGYRVDANISIKLKDFSKIGPIAKGCRLWTLLTRPSAICWTTWTQPRSRRWKTRCGAPIAKPMRSRNPADARLAICPTRQSIPMSNSPSVP